VLLCASSIALIVLLDSVPEVEAVVDVFAVELVDAVDALATSKVLDAVLVFAVEEVDAFFLAAVSS
jgi:hypothetical protein